MRRGDRGPALGIDAVDIYGLSEVMGPGVASECVETKDGPVVWEDHFYPEIIDPETGEVLPDGEEGELVFTTLTKEALPVVRYRTRDLTRLLPPTARSMRRMGKITGRSRRHADHPRRQRLPDPDRGADPAAWPALAALPARGQRARATSTGWRSTSSCDRGSPRRTRARRDCRGRAPAPHQVLYRHHARA